MTLCLGIDPDTHDLAIASWDDLGPVRGHVVHAPKRKGIVGPGAAMAMACALKDPWPDFGRLPEPGVGSFRIEGGRPRTYDEPLVDMIDACAVEAQELRRGPGARHARPEDIVTLGQVAGAAVMSVFYRYLHCPVYFTKPSEWKGSVVKHAMQARLYEELRWGYVLRGTGKPTHAEPQDVPADWPEFGSGQWKHLGDALLLARWCWERETGRKWVRS